MRALARRPRPRTGTAAPSGVRRPTLASVNTTSHRPLRAAAGALLVAGLLAACGGTAEPEAMVSATLHAQSDASSGASPSSDASSSSDASPSSSASPSSGASPSAGAETFSYPGRTGATALELLLEADPSAEVTGEGENAFVTAIGGRAADDSKKEFWSLSVDGEPAQVGAGTLETEDGQEITWTIETY